jgi:putative transposase
VVWCRKYRRPVLPDRVEKRLVELIEAAAMGDMKVQAIEVMPDHVGLFIEKDPHWPPAEFVGEFVGKIKANTSRVLREEFPQLRCRLPTLWSRSYFCATLSAVSEATVRRYIEAKKGR